MKFSLKKPSGQDERQVEPERYFSATLDSEV
jgi:hypothetical protein